MEINQRLTFLDAYLMARAWRNVETLIPAGCTRREICVYVCVYACVCVCVCTFAVSPNRGTLRNGGQQTGRAWHHSNASSHVHVYRTDFVRNETATFIVIIWLRVARNCSAESRIPVQIPGNFLEKEKENSEGSMLIANQSVLSVSSKRRKIENRWFLEQRYKWLLLIIGWERFILFFFFEELERQKAIIQGEN